MTELLYCVQIHGSHATEKNEQIITTTQQVTTLHTHWIQDLLWEKNAIPDSWHTTTGLEKKILNTSLFMTSISQIMLALGKVLFVLLIIQLTDDLPGPLPVSLMKRKCYLPRRKIYLSQMSGWHFFWALPTDTSEALCIPEHVWGQHDDEDNDDNDDDDVDDDNTNDVMAKMWD